MEENPAKEWREIIPSAAVQSQSQKARGDGGEPLSARVQRLKRKSTAEDFPPPATSEKKKRGRPRKGTENSQLSSSRSPPASAVLSVRQINSELTSQEDVAVEDRGQREKSMLEEDLDISND